MVGRPHAKAAKRDTGSLGRGEHTEPPPPPPWPHQSPHLLKKQWGLWRRLPKALIYITTLQEAAHARQLPAPTAPQGAGLLPSGPPGRDPTCSFCLNPRHSGINLRCVSPSSTSKHSLIDMLQTFLALSFSNSVRRHFNESELGQFRAETRISIHSRGTFSQDLSQEAKLFRSPSGIVSKFLGARLPSSREVLISLLSQSYLLAACFLSFPFLFFPSRPIDTIIRNSWFCAHIERRPEWVC